MKNYLSFGGGGMNERQAFVDGGMHILSHVQCLLKDLGASKPLIEEITDTESVKTLEAEAAARYPDKRCENKLPLSSIAAARDALMVRIEEKQYMKVLGLTGYRACLLEEEWKKHLKIVTDWLISEYEIPDKRCGTCAFWKHYVCYSEDASLQAGIAECSDNFCCIHWRERG